MRRLLGFLFWCLVLAVFLGGAWVAFTDAGQAFMDDLLGSGTGTTAARTTTATDAFAPDASGTVALATGTCHDVVVEPEESTEPAGPGSVLDVTTLPCSEPHGAEALAVVRIDGGPNAAWPGRDAIVAALDTVCDDAFRSVIGRAPVADDTWRRFTLFPSPESWNAGDRQGVCEVARSDGTAMTGSLVAGTLAP